jgi:hypothetical protein
MALMAQRIIEAKIDLNFSDTHAVSVILDAQRLISGGFSPNHLCASRSDVDQAIETASQSARIYRFDASIVGHITDLVRSDECLDAALAQSRLPFDVVFYEWSEEDLEWGALTRVVEDVEECLVFFAQKGDAPKPALVFKRHRGSRQRYIETFECCPFGATFDEREHLLQWISGRPVLLTSLLNIHGFVETSENQWPDKLQAARRKRGKLPLLSYNNVTLRVPKTKNGSSDPKSIAEFGIRYHERSGHFKAPARKCGQKQIVWVASYWAGNRDRGVVLKTRNVRPDK